MEGLVVKLGIIFVGILLLAASFLMHSYKKITVNYTVIWELLGVVLIIIGAVPVFSEWTKKLASGTGLAFACVGAIFLFEEFRNSVLISQLLFKTREMAMQLSMLNQENEQLMNEIERLACIVEDGDGKEEKKDIVRS